MGDVRKSVNEDTNEVSWMTKKRLWNETNYDYNLRYSMSQEIPAKPISEKVFKPDLVRYKNRSSYLVFDNAVRIDITIVTSSGLISYELEVELMNHGKLDLFDKAMQVITRLVLDTVYLYTWKEKTDLINFVNYILGSNKRGYLDHYFLVQARNLKLRDMVYGGLIGNEKTGYSVTHKADGIRRMLVFHESGIWLISTDTFSKISDARMIDFLGTILDGEMIPPEKRLPGSPQNQFWYLVFDTLAWNRDASVQKKTHNQRLSFAQIIADGLNAPNGRTQVIQVNTKTFRVFNTPQEFFKIIREMYREQEFLLYRNDGFMFTPTDTEYNPKVDRMALYKRVLTQYPDICKWKPQEELTIDFLIKWTNDESSAEGNKPQSQSAESQSDRQLELYSGDKGQNVKFVGSNTFRLTSDMIDANNEMLQNLPNNTIVEFRFDKERQMLVPVRVRNDKPKPNRIDIANDVWSDIENPLDKATMEGNSFTLLRRYHNRIKKELFNNNKGKTLLDIGSGRFQDLNKWRGYSKILAVEPNGEYIKEMNRRLETSDIKDRVKIVQCGGEDTDRITSEAIKWLGKADVISAMLSLSFFWQSENLVNGLCNTILSNINLGGKFIFLTIDGDLVESTFDPPLAGLPLTRLDLGKVVTIEYFG
ncbi:MAG TPA: hypothetical protein VFD03_10505, partial [Clostridia bacterium]|nr:hypothetical protein [Clostridia bacterium]